MEIFGYEKSEILYEYEEKLLELREATIHCTYDELENILSFMAYAKEEWIRLGETYGHVHYRDWDGSWKRRSYETPDLIITKGEASTSSDEVVVELEPTEDDSQIRVVPYDSSLDSIIYTHENAVHALCKNEMTRYNKAFKQHGYELDGAIYWNEFGDWRRAYSERIPYKDGYNCFFRVGVKKDGKYVSYDAGEETLLADTIYLSEISHDGEALNVRLYDEDENSLAEVFAGMLEIVKSLQ